MTRQNAEERHVRFARLSRFNGNIRIFLNLESRVSIISPPPSLSLYIYISLRSLHFDIFTSAKCFSRAPEKLSSVST